MVSGWLPGGGIPEPAQRVGLVSVPVEAERAEELVRLFQQGLVLTHDSERTQSERLGVLPGTEEGCGLLLHTPGIANRGQSIEAGHACDEAEPALVPAPGRLGLNQQLVDKRKIATDE